MHDQKVQPFTEDKEAAHEHVTDHIRDLGEGLSHEADFSHEASLHKKSFPVDPTTLGENSEKTSKNPRWKRTMDVDPESRRRMREITRLISPEQPAASPASESPDTQREREEYQDDKKRGIDEPESVPTVAQDEVLTPRPLTMNSDTRNDEVAVDVPVPEGTVEMGGENNQHWITEEAFFTVTPGARQVRQRKEVKMNRLLPDPAQDPSG